MTEERLTENQRNILETIHRFDKQEKALIKEVQRFKKRSHYKFCIEDYLHSLSMIKFRLVLIELDLDDGSKMRSAYRTLQNLKKKQLVIFDVENDGGAIVRIVNLRLTRKGESLLDFLM